MKKKIEDLINEYGYVTDIGFVKELIKDLYYEDIDNPDYKEWFDQVDNELVDLGGGKFSLMKENGQTYLGGPGGLSGIRFIRLREYLEETKPLWSDRELTLEDCPDLLGVIVHKVNKQLENFVGRETNFKNKV